MCEDGYHTARRSGAACASTARFWPAQTAYIKHFEVTDEADGKNVADVAAARDDLNPETL